MELQKTSWLDLNRGGIWIIAFFIFSVAIMGIGALTPINQTNARSTYNDLQNESKYTATVPLIFGNNFFECLVLFTPFIGPLYSMLVFFNTGYVVAAIAVVRSQNPASLFLYLFLFPHTWLEFFLPIRLVSERFSCIRYCEGRFKQETVRTRVMITICALVLLMAAVAEVIAILLGG
jgi:uncharacterized membrane protein SpoIIM required for sporulation